MNKKVASMNGFGHALIWDNVVSAMRANVCVGILEEVQSVPKRKEEWMEVVVVRPNVHFDVFFKKPSDFKSQSSPWLKWCPPNCQVQRGNRLLCCPPSTTLGGWVLPRQEEAWFSQSRSSTLWPVPYCRERITKSCRSPADTHKDNGRK